MRLALRAIKICALLERLKLYRVNEKVKKGGESPNRSKYNEMEIHRTNVTAKARRLVHQWRPVIDFSLRDIWEINRRRRLWPHPCYICGWNRCSCMMCIFSLPSHWAGIRELFPDDFKALLPEH